MRTLLATAAAVVALGACGGGEDDFYVGADPVETEGETYPEPAPESDETNDRELFRLAMEVTWGDNPDELVLYCDLVHTFGTDASVEQMESQWDYSAGEFYEDIAEEVMIDLCGPTFQS